MMRERERELLYRRSPSVIHFHQQLLHHQQSSRRQHQPLSSPLSPLSSFFYSSAEVAGRPNSLLSIHTHHFRSSCVGLSLPRFCRCWRRRHQHSARRPSTRVSLLCLLPQIPKKSPIPTSSSSRSTSPRLPPPTTTAGCKTSISRARPNEQSSESDRNSLSPTTSSRA
jgi:hypothetical protein